MPILLNDTPSLFRTGMLLILNRELLFYITEFLEFTDSVRLGCICRAIYDEKFFTKEYYRRRIGLGIIEKELIVQHHDIVYYHPCSILYHYFIHQKLRVGLKPIGMPRKEISFGSVNECMKRMRNASFDGLKVFLLQNKTPVLRIGTYDPAFNKTLKVGDSVDALDGDGIWYEAKIIARLDNEKFRLHFRNWSDVFDVDIPIDSPMIAPPYTHVDDWRSKLREASLVGIKFGRKWYDAVIIGRDDKVITIRPPMEFEHFMQIEVESDKIAPIDLHCIQKNEQGYKTRNHFLKKMYKNGNTPIYYNIIRRCIHT